MNYRSRLRPLRIDWIRTTTFGRVLRYMTDGVIATDRRGNVLLVNERALATLGIDQSAIGISIFASAIKDQYTFDRLAVVMTGKSSWISDQGVFHPQGRILHSPWDRLPHRGGSGSTDVTEQERRPEQECGTLYPTSHTNCGRLPYPILKPCVKGLAGRGHCTAVPQCYSVGDQPWWMIGNLLDLSKIHEGQYKLNLEYITLTHGQSYLDRFEFMLETESWPEYPLERDFTSREIYLEWPDRVT